MAQSSTILGKYNLLAVIGDGAEGRVYRAICVSNDVPGLAHGELVALKRLKSTGHEKEFQQFRRQIEILSKLNHPNIVRYKDSFVWREKELEEDIHCLVMELLDGESLKTLLEKNTGGLPWSQARGILLQTLQALEYARKNGVIHRDLKPSNIYITNSGVLKLVDFGIARHDDRDATSTGSVAGAKGTFDYMAPDFALLHGGFRGDEQSDIFSFGVIMHYALTGCLPFPPLGENADRAYFVRWLGNQLPTPEFRHPIFKVLSHARTCIRTCIAPNREARFKTFRELMADFAQIEYRKLRQGTEIYEYTDWLGKGGFGEVYKARQLSNGREVAVKRLFNIGHSSRFVREAKILRNAAHPGLTEYIDFFETCSREDEREYYLILEYLEGMPGASLRNRIKNSDSGLDLVQTLKLFICYLDCLEHLHKNGIIHRDIKPGNLYAPENNPSKGKVFDLGVAHDEEGTRTHGQVPGTLDFMPPEFAAQESGRGSAQSDIYSMGVTLYQALTRKLPFPRLPENGTEAWVAFFKRARNPMECQFDHPVFKQHPKLVSLLRQTLAHDPKRRFNSAGLMRDEIKIFLANIPGLLLDDVSTASGLRSLTDEVGTATVGARTFDQIASGHERRNQECAARKPKLLAGLFKVSAIISAVVVLGAGGYFGWNRLQAQRRENLYDNAVAEAQAHFKAGDFAGCIIQANKAIAIHKDDSIMQQLIVAAQLQIKLQESYANAIQNAQRALDLHDYSNTLTWAAVALQKMPNDLPATRLQDTAQSVLDNYHADASRANAAYKNDDFPGASAEASNALAICPDDHGMQQLETEACAQIATRQTYNDAIKEARAAFNNWDFSNAIFHANAALQEFPGDTAATELHNSAQGRLNNFHNYAKAANTAFRKDDFAAAEADAEKALAIIGNNDAMAKVKAGAQQELYDNAYKHATADFHRGDFTNALAWVNAALQQIPGESDAAKLRDHAQALLNNYHHAVIAANAAYQKDDYETTVIEANNALYIYGSDTKMKRIRDNAQSQMAREQAREIEIKSPLNSPALQAEAAYKSFRVAYAKYDYIEALQKLDLLGDHLLQRKSQMHVDVSAQLAEVERLRNITLEADDASLREQLTKFPERLLDNRYPREEVLDGIKTELADMRLYHAETFGFSATNDGERQLPDLWTNISRQINLNTTQ